MVHTLLRKILDPQLQPQRSWKDVFDSPGLVDFAIGVYLVNSVPNLPEGKVQFFGEIQLKEGL